MYQVNRSKKPLKGSISLPSSKSEANRVLIIQAMVGGELHNLSLSDDIRILRTALDQIKQLKEREIDVGHTGTAFRFLTAYLSHLPNTHFKLTGSNRMLQRPCGALVEALRELGAHIVYNGKKGFPPLSIVGQKLQSNTVEIRGDISSQFISALMLIGPQLENGLNIQLSTPLVSRPYVELTANIMSHYGAELRMTKNRIEVSPKKYRTCSYTVESDWSAASYWYLMVSLYGGSLILDGLKKESWQGDSKIQDLFQQFGVSTHFKNDLCTIEKSNSISLKTFSADFTDMPDMAQTFIGLCAGLGIEGRFKGLSTLKIKETNRIDAMANELRKMGLYCETGKDWLSIKGKVHSGNIELETYQDHRMAMALSPLSPLFAKFTVKDPTVVNKSYPLFWDHLESFGYKISPIL